MYGNEGLALFGSVLAGSESIAMAYITKYSKSLNTSHLLIGIVIYALVIPFLLTKSLDYSGIGTVNLFWNIITSVSMIIIGYYMFDEKVNHLHLISLIFGISSIVLLYFAESYGK